MSEETADLVRRHIDGLLDEGGRRRLEALLEADVDARRVYVAELRLHAALRVKLKGVGHPIERRRIRRAAGTNAGPWIAAAATLAFAVLVYSSLPKNLPPLRPVEVTRAPEPPPPPPAPPPAQPPPPLPPREPIVIPPPPKEEIKPPTRSIPPPPPPARPEPAPPPTVAAVVAVARVERVEGDVFLASGEPARAGLELPSGAGLVCRPAASVDIAFPDGSVVRLAADAAIARVEDKLVVLERGSLSARAARQEAARPLRFRTPHAEAVVLGTVLRLSVRADGTRLDVEEGRVRFTKLDGGARADVGARHYAVAGPAWTPAARPAPRTPIEAALAERGAVTVNFGPEGAALPEGTLNDAAQAFEAARGYGWTGPAEERGAARRAKPADVLRATHVWAGTRTRAALWTARVPNGAYLVSVCMGDDRPQGPHHVAIEGRVVIDAQVTAADQYLEIKDLPVLVKDGTLTIAVGGHQKPSVGKGADSTLCWLHLRHAR